MAACPHDCELWLYMHAAMTAIPGKHVCCVVMHRAVTARVPSKTGRLHVGHHQIVTNWYHVTSTTFVLQADWLAVLWLSVTSKLLPAQCASTFKSDRESDTDWLRRDASS
jgi:hypothetical protein